jgi:hypothetical protein
LIKWRTKLGRKIAGNVSIDAIQTLLGVVELEGQRFKVLILSTSSTTDLFRSNGEDRVRKRARKARLVFRGGIGREEKKLISGRKVGGIWKRTALLADSNPFLMKAIFSSGMIF